MGWGHRHPMIECSWSLPTRSSAVTKIKVRYKSRQTLLEFERVECLVQDKFNDDVPVAADAP